MRDLEQKCLSALKEIAAYMDPEEIRAEAEEGQDDYGPDAEETLEMAYENVLSTARHAIAIGNEQTPAEALAEWATKGPPMALAAGCYVAINITETK